MPSFKFGRADGGLDGVDLVPAAATTLVDAATKVAAAHQVYVPVVGSTAVTLPKDWAVGSPITVANNAASAVALLVFPPWDSAEDAAAGGKIYGTNTTVSADGSVSVAQGKCAVFFPHPNGIDFTVVLGA